MNKLVLIFLFLSFPLSAQVIVIDPGHGYCADCTQNCTSNVRSDTEILTALAVGKKLETLLANCPTITTYFTRETNGCGDFPSLSQRAAMSNSWGADRFLSIHCNAGGGSGTETFWCDNSASSNAECQTYSEEVQSQMVLFGQWNDRRVVEDFSYLNFHLGVLSPTNAVGTLSEIGFVDSVDATKLLDDTWRNNFAQAYYVALQNNLGFSCSSVPVNDVCTNSISLESNTVCTTTVGSVDNATGDGLGGMSCDLFGGTPLEAGVFYHFTARQTSHTITVSPTASSTLDAVVGLYSGASCASFNEIDCLDAPGTSPVVITNNNLVIGEQYWIRIYDYGSVAPSNGDFDICITHQAPVNDTCANSMVLTSNTTCNPTTGTVNDATADGLGIGSCDAFGGTPLEAGVFYHFTANTTEHTITVTPTASSTLDAVVVLYSGTDCNNLTEISCLDAPGTGAVVITNTTLVAGEQYWIRIYDYGSVGPSNGDFNICVTHPENPDIVIQDLYTIPANPQIGQQVDLYVDIRNIGNGDATNFTVDFQINGSSVGMNNVSNLGAGVTTSEFVDNYVFTGAGMYNYCVYMSAPTGEINTANNSYCTTIDINNNNLLVTPIVLLQGPILNESSIMKDDIRVQNLIPTTAPYSDALSCNATVFNISGTNAIIDWVFVELRDPNNSQNIVYSKSGLIQANGSIVATDGVSPMTFNAPNGNYFVAIRHRNHLGIMSLNTISLNNSNTIINFKDGSTPTYGTNAQTTIGVPNGELALWCGNADGNNFILFSGENNDSNEIKNEILNENNILGLLTYAVNDYSLKDFDLNGYAKFSGDQNDTNFIKNNVLQHPNNILSLLSYKITEQLP